MSLAHTVAADPDAPAILSFKDVSVVYKGAVGALRELDALLHDLPEQFEMHPRVAKIMDDRRKMSAGALAIDWDDDVIKGTLVAKDGKIVHDMLTGQGGKK